MRREREIALLAIGIAVAVTLPFAWFIAARHGLWGVPFAMLMSAAVTHLVWRYVHRR